MTQSINIKDLHSRHLQTSHFRYRRSISEPSARDTRQWHHLQRFDKVAARLHQILTRKNANSPLGFRANLRRFDKVAIRSHQILTRKVTKPLLDFRAVFTAL